MAVTDASMLQRRDTAANWQSNNPTLKNGELGFETDTGAYKFGDGATAWNSLGYQLAPRRSASTTVTVAAGGTNTGTLVLDTSDVVYSVTVDKACWLRFYNSAAASSADTGRDRATDPAAGSGVLFEIITAGAETIFLSPSVVVVNAESPATASYPFRVTNDAGTADVQVSVGFLRLFG
jgi:hypothetical protein